MRITPTTNAMTARMRKSRPVPVDTHDDDSRDQYDLIASLVPGGTRFYFGAFTQENGRRDVTFEREIRDTGSYACYTILGGLPPLPNEALSHIAVFIDEGLLRAEYRLKEE